MLRFALPLLTLLAAAPALADNGWSIINTPLPGVAQAIGGYQAGCLQGGAVLPLLGEGYQVMRASRRCRRPAPRCWRQDQLAPRIPAPWRGPSPAASAACRKSATPMIPDKG